MLFSMNIIDFTKRRSIRLATIQVAVDSAINSWIRWLYQEEKYHYSTNLSKQEWCYNKIRYCDSGLRFWEELVTPFLIGFYRNCFDAIIITNTYRFFMILSSFCGILHVYFSKNDGIQQKCTVNSQIFHWFWCLHSFDAPVSKVRSRGRNRTDWTRT